MDCCNERSLHPYTHWLTGVPVRGSGACPTVGWLPQDRAIDKILARADQKARTDCVLKLGITNSPDSTIDLVARYGSDKANAFNDCVLNELGVGAWR